MQDYMQVIHHAAVKGHAELLISLIDKFGVQPQEKTIEVVIIMYIHTY